MDKERELEASSNVARITHLVSAHTGTPTKVTGDHGFCFDVAQRQTLTDLHVIIWLAADVRPRLQIG